MNLIFCGLPGSGKSTNARLVAEKLGWECLETDRLIEKKYARENGEDLSCRQIYQKIGEKKFRELENEILTKLSISHTVIDIGGGTLNNPENIKALKKLGMFVYLQEKDSEKLFQRVTHRGIPAYLEPSEPYTSFLKLISERESIYTQVADFTVDITGKRPAEITPQILRMVNIHGS